MCNLHAYHWGIVCILEGFMASIHVCSCRFYVYIPGSPFLPISWLFKDIPFLGHSLENRIPWSQPQMLIHQIWAHPRVSAVTDLHLWTCWPAYSVADVLLGASFDISLFGECGWPWDVSKCQCRQREHGDAPGRCWFSSSVFIKLLLGDQYCVRWEVQNVIFKNLIGSSGKDKLLRKR